MVVSFNHDPCHHEVDATNYQVSHPVVYLCSHARFQGRVALLPIKASNSVEKQRFGVYTSRHTVFSTFRCLCLSSVSCSLRRKSRARIEYGGTPNGKCGGIRIHNSPTVETSTEENRSQAPQATLHERSTPTYGHRRMKTAHALKESSAHSEGSCL